MTAVHQQPRFTVFRKFTKTKPTQRRCRKVSAQAADDVIDDVTEQSNKDSGDAAGFCGESFANSGELLASLTPLLFSMKLFGMYFEREDRHRRRTDDPEWDPASSENRRSSRRLRVYATVVLFLVWLNAVRFGSLFATDNNYGKLLTKINTLSWFVLLAIMFTAYYVASHRRQLVELILTVPVTRDCVVSARRSTENSYIFCIFSMFYGLIA